LIFDIAEKLRSNELALSCGIAAEPDEPELLDELLLPQAATTRAAHAATDVRTSLLVTLLLIKSNETTSFVGLLVRTHKWPQGLIRLRAAAATPVTVNRRLPAINVGVNITALALKNS